MAQGRVIQLSRKPLFARLDELPGLSGMRQDFIKVRVSSLPWQQSLIAWSSSSFPWFLRMTRSPRPYQVAIPRSKRRGSISTLRLPQGRVMSLGVVSGAYLKYKQLQNGTGARSRSGTGCLDLTSCVGRTNSPGVYPFSRSIRPIFCRSSCTSHEVLCLSLPRDGRSRRGLPVFPRQDRPGTG